MIFPVERWLAHRPVMESVEAIETVADVLAVASYIKAWREETWSVVPACFDPFLHLMELGHLAQFVSMQRAIAMAGIGEADDPFAETLDQMLNPRWGYFGGGFPRYTLARVDQAGAICLRHRHLFVGGIGILRSHTGRI